MLLLAAASVSGGGGSLSMSGSVMNFAHTGGHHKHTDQSDDKVTSTTSVVLTESEEDEDTSSDDVLSFSLKRQNYDLYPYFGASPDAYTKYAFMADYSAIIEPSQPMELVAWGGGASDSSSSNTFRFTVCKSKDESECYEGSSEESVTIACTPYEKFSVLVEEVDEDDNVVDLVEGNAMCMYVRREIRSLTDDDLSATMDAMYTLWDVSDEDGQARFGDDYHSSAYFSAAHDFNAAQQDADHIHEGLGFLPQHIKLTNMFEVSMQAVDPSVSLPYWDFTIDVADGLSIFESPIFTKDTFGTIHPPADSFWGFTWRNDSLGDCHIQNGRWKKIKAELNTRFEDLSNGFGYMRGPWNTNPSKYVTRFSAYSPTLPSCTDYYGGLGLPGFMSFLQDAPYGSHASTHGVIGAVFGCDLLDGFREDGLILDEDSQLQICKKWGFYMKELYRADYISPRTNCTAGDSLTPEDIDCGFICNADKYDDMDEGLADILGKEYIKSSMTDSEWGEFRDFICYGDGSLVFVGDHLESASPSDPSFWPIHPTQERLLQLKYMVGSVSGGGWPTDALTDYVCDKSECYESDYGAKDTYAMCCYGHYENDQMLDFVNGEKNSGYGPTNKETLDGTDPTSAAYSMTYIYDHFKWDHCDEDFDAEIASLAAADSAEESTHVPTPGTMEVTTAAPTPSPSKSADSQTKKHKDKDIPSQSDSSSDSSSSSSKSKSKSKSKKSSSK